MDIAPRDMNYESIAKMIRIFCTLLAYALFSLSFTSGVLADKNPEEIVSSNKITVKRIELKKTYIYDVAVIRFPPNSYALSPSDIIFLKKLVRKMRKKNSYSSVFVAAWPDQTPPRKTIGPNGYTTSEKKIASQRLFEVNDLIESVTRLDKRAIKTFNMASSVGFWSLIAKTDDYKLKSAIESKDSKRIISLPHEYRILLNEGGDERVVVILKTEITQHTID